MTKEKTETPTYDGAWPPFVPIFYEHKQAKWRRVRASNNFQFSEQNCPEWKEASNCRRQWRGQLILRLLLNQLCRSLNDFHSNQLRLLFIHILWCVKNISGSTETLFRISTTWCSYWDFCQIPLRIILEVLIIFNLIYLRSTSIILFSNSW